MCKHLSHLLCVCMDLLSTTEAAYWAWHENRNVSISVLIIFNIVRFVTCFIMRDLNEPFFPEWFSDIISNLVRFANTCKVVPAVWPWPIQSYCYSCCRWLHGKHCCNHVCVCSLYRFESIVLTFILLFFSISLWCCLSKSHCIFITTLLKVSPQLETLRRTATLSEAMLAIMVKNVM